MRIERILVPTDFSAPAAAAWKYAQWLAGRFKSRIHLLHVVTLPYLYDPWGTESVALRMGDLLAQSEKVRAHDRAARAARRHSHRNRDPRPTDPRLRFSTAH